MKVPVYLCCHDLSVNDMFADFLSLYFEQVTSISSEDLLHQPELEKSIIIWHVNADSRAALERLLAMFSRDYPAFVFVGGAVPEDIETFTPSPAYVHRPMPVKLPALKQAVDHLLRCKSQPVKRINGTWSFDIAHKTLCSHENGESVMLTQKECDLLLYLTETSGNIIDKATLLSSVWGYEDSLNTRTLETHIYRLRSKLEPVFPEDHGILTAENGYRFVA